MAARDRKAVIDFFEWLPEASLYAHGTFLSPETIELLIKFQDNSPEWGNLDLNAQNQTENSSCTLGLRDYLRTIIIETVLQKFNKCENMYTNYSADPIHPLTRGIHPAAIISGCNEYLKLLPFEWYTVQVPSWNSSCSANSAVQYLLRLPFPIKLPPEAIQIIERVELPGGSFFPGYTLAELQEFKKEITKAFMGGIKGKLDVRRASDSPDKKQYSLTYKEAMNPGILLGPPIGGIFSFDPRLCPTARIPDNAVYLESSFQHDQELRTKTVRGSQVNTCDDMTLSNAVSESLRSSADVLQLKEIQKNDDHASSDNIMHAIPNLYAVMSDPKERKLQKKFSQIVDAGLTGREFIFPVESIPFGTLHSQIVCDEVSICRPAFLLANCALVTVLIYGIPYVFLVSGAGVRKGDAVSLISKDTNIPFTLGNSSCSLLGSDSSRLLHLPYLWSQRPEKSKELLNFHVPLSSRLLRATLLRSVEEDVQNRFTIFIIAKTLIWDSLDDNARIAFLDMLPSNDKAAISVRPRLSSKLVPSWGAIGMLLAAFPIVAPEIDCRSPIRAALGRVISQFAQMVAYFSCSLVSCENVKDADLPRNFPFLDIIFIHSISMLLDLPMISSCKTAALQKLLSSPANSLLEQEIFPLKTYSPHNDFSTTAQSYIYDQPNGESGANYETSLDFAFVRSFYPPELYSPTLPRECPRLHRPGKTPHPDVYSISSWQLPNSFVRFLAVNSSAYFSESSRSNISTSSKSLTLSQRHTDDTKMPTCRSKNKYSLPAFDKLALRLKLKHVVPPLGVNNLKRHHRSTTSSRVTNKATVSQKEQSNSSDDTNNLFIQHEGSMNEELYAAKCEQLQQICSSGKNTDAGFARNRHKSGKWLSESHKKKHKKAINSDFNEDVCRSHKMTSVALSKEHSCEGNSNAFLSIARTSHHIPHSRNSSEKEVRLSSNSSYGNEETDKDKMVLVTDTSGSAQESWGISSAEECRKCYNSIARKSSKDCKSPNCKKTKLSIKIQQSRHRLYKTYTNNIYPSTGEYSINQVRQASCNRDYGMLQSSNSLAIHTCYVADDLPCTKSHNNRKTLGVPAKCCRLNCEDENIFGIEDCRLSNENSHKSLGLYRLRKTKYKDCVGRALAGNSRQIRKTRKQTRNDRDTQLQEEKNWHVDKKENVCQESECRCNDSLERRRISKEAIERSEGLKIDGKRVFSSNLSERKYCCEENENCRESKSQQRHFCNLIRRGDKTQTVQSKGYGSNGGSDSEFESYDEPRVIKTFPKNHGVYVSEQLVEEESNRKNKHHCKDKIRESLSNQNRNVSEGKPYDFENRKKYPSPLRNRDSGENAHSGKTGGGTKYEMSRLRHEIAQRRRAEAHAYNGIRCKSHTHHCCDKRFDRGTENVQRSRARTKYQTKCRRKLLKEVNANEGQSKRHSPTKFETQNDFGFVGEYQSLKGRKEKYSFMEERERGHCLEKKVRNHRAKEFEEYWNYKPDYLRTADDFNDRETVSSDSDHTRSYEAGKCISETYDAHQSHESRSKSKKDKGGAIRSKKIFDQSIRLDSNKSTYETNCYNRSDENKNERCRSKVDYIQYFTPHEGSSQKICGGKTKEKWVSRTLIHSGQRKNDRKHENLTKENSSKLPTKFHANKMAALKSYDTSVDLGAEIEVKDSRIWGSDAFESDELSQKTESEEASALEAVVGALGRPKTFDEMIDRDRLELNDKMPIFELKVLAMDRYFAKITNKKSLEMHSKPQLSEVQASMSSSSHLVLRSRKKGYFVLRIDRCCKMPRGRKPPAVIPAGNKSESSVMRGPGKRLRGTLLQSDQYTSDSSRLPAYDAILCGLKNLFTRDDTFDAESDDYQRALRGKAGGNNYSLENPSEDGLALDPPLEVGLEYTIDVWIKLPAKGRGPNRALLSSQNMTLLGFFQNTIGACNTRKDDNVTIIPKINEDKKLSLKKIPNGWHRLIVTESGSQNERRYFLDGYDVGKSMACGSKEINYIDP